MDADEPWDWSKRLADTRARLESMTTDALLWEVRHVVDRAQTDLGPMPWRLARLYQDALNGRLGPSLQMLHPGVHA